MADTTSYPYDTVAIVITDLGGQYFQGTGVLLSPDELLTASHVLYSPAYGAASSVAVAPGYQSGTEPYGEATALNYHYFQVGNADDTISATDSQSDYAVVHLSRPFDNLGNMGLEANYAGGQVYVTGYPGNANGAQVTTQETVSLDPNYTLLDGTSIGAGSSGGPVWVASSTGADVVGLVSSELGGTGSTGYFTQITTAVYNQIEAWVAQDDGAAKLAASGIPLAVEDTTTNTALPATVTPYSGPVSGLQDEYINVTSDSLNIQAGSPNWFIHSGGGNDAIAVSSGTNVLDGGGGSNFLSGGSGTDTFFVDDRSPVADIWSSVADFHAGDAATLWGITPGQFTLAWADGQGAADYTGLTLHATAPNQTIASLTLVGFSQADLSNGTLSVSYGTDAASGSSYLNIHNNL